VRAFLQEHRRWLITALLFFISLISYLDRQTLSVLANTLDQTLGVSPAQYSYVVTAFLIGSGIGYSFAGRVIDRLGARISFAVAVAVWSVVAVLHSLAVGWISLLVLRLILGLGESFATPTAAKVLTAWIPRRERGLCWAVFSMGNFVGAVIAPPLVVWLTLRYNWRISFVATGALGFALLLVWLWFYDNPEKHRMVSASERKVILEGRDLTPVAFGRVSTLRLLRHPAVLGFFFTRFFTDSFTLFFVFWLPAYFQTSRAFTLAMIGLMAWIPYLGADVGFLTGGAISDWLVRRGVDSRRARKGVMLVAACLMPLTLVAVRVQAAPLALGLITFIMLLQAAWNTNLTTLTIESTPPQHVASVIAVALLGGTLGGSISTLLTGRVIAAVGYVPVFTALGFVHLTAYAIMSAGLRAADSQKEAITAA